MATFNITVEGISGTPLVQTFNTANTTCASIYELFISATNGDVVTFSLVNGGYTDYTCQLSTNNGSFITVSNTSFNITYNNAATVKITMLNTNVVETVNITTTVNNTTSSVTQDVITSRDSTGTPC